MTTIRVLRLCLLVLVGIRGSGKSTFANRHFAPGQIVSDDRCLDLVADGDPTAESDARELAHQLVEVRARRGLLTVVDDAGLDRRGRRQLVALAKRYQVPAEAVVLDVDPAVAKRRNARRVDRDVSPDVVDEQSRRLREQLPRFRDEGFRRVHVLTGADIEDAEFDFAPARHDRTELSGPFDLVGDVHGCRAELESLLERLGYRLERDERGRAVDAVHPGGRTLVSVGDLVDRGPDTPGVLRLVMGMVDNGHALCVSGNHEAKLVRALNGRKVRVAYGLAESLEQLAGETAEFRARALSFMDGLVDHYRLDAGRLVVAHAGLKESYHGRTSGRVRAFALYGDTTGELDQDGLPVRYPWADDYRGAATVVYGHTPVLDAVWVNNTICLDTGCVFGGRLTALRYPERELVAVDALRTWYAPVRPLAPVTLPDAPG